MTRIESDDAGSGSHNNDDYDATTNMIDEIRKLIIHNRTITINLKRHYMCISIILYFLPIAVDSNLFIRLLY